MQTPIIPAGTINIQVSPGPVRDSRRARRDDPEGRLVVWVAARGCRVGAPCWDNLC